MILGTAAYMSPEQAKGRQADKRSDVWAFGAVLYEMLSGQRAFKGDDISDTLAAVLRQDIDWTALPASTPASVRRLIARCLDRDVRRRLRDIGEARIVLDDPAAPARGDAGAWPSSHRRGRCGDARFPSCSPRSSPAHWPEPPCGTSAQASAAARGDSILRSRCRKDRRSHSISRHVIAMSPDGAQMVYVANGRLYLRSMSELDAHAIQGTEGYQAVHGSCLFAGRPIGRLLRGRGSDAQENCVTGGAAVTICPADNPFGISWGPDGIVFGQGSKGIMRVSPNGGTPEVLVRRQRR